MTPCACCANTNLPTRRRFWERCFRAVDAQGTQSQLRSQLRILHDTLKDHAERNLGAVIPADVLFSAISSRLVETGVLLNELDLRIRASSMQLTVTGWIIEGATTWQNDGEQN